jgi:uncharacterized membrane protein YbhN (UPF0104 family)
LVLAGGLVFLLLYWSETSLADVWRTTRTLTPGAFLASLGVQALIYALRAGRLWVLFPRRPRPPVLRLIPISAAHSLATYVLPAKTGEASLVVYLRALCALPATEGLALLLVSRILDLTVVAGSLGAACVLLSLGGAFAELEWLGALGGLLCVLALLFAWLSAKGGDLVDLVLRLLRRTGLDRTRLGTRSIDLAQRVAEAMRSIGRGRFWLGVLVSLPIWVGVYLFYAILARAFGLSDLPFVEAVFGSSLAVLSNLLPVNGFAGFGTQDVGWVAGFTALGADREIATQSALAFHLVYLANMVGFGLLGHLVLGFAPRRPASAS